MAPGMETIVTLVRTSLRALAVVTLALLGDRASAGISGEGRPVVDAATSGDFARLVDVGDGRRLYLECRGAGGPTVILEAGYRSPATVWSEDLLHPDKPRAAMVLQGVAAFTRVCAYERPGVAAVLGGKLHPSRSDPVPMPRGAEGVVTDLHALLRAAGVQGPYVLVGHSLGGLFVRLYAATYPREVVGLVLVDALYEGIEGQLTPEELAAYVRLNSEVPPEVAGYRDFETLDLAAAMRVVRRATERDPLRPLPLVVLSKAHPFGVSARELGFPPEALERAWGAAQNELAGLVPGTQHVIATESGHYIQFEQPQLVIDAVRRVVLAVRGAHATPWGAHPR